MKLTATGIKTGGIALKLLPLTIAVGDNGAGKTAIADALKLALLGYHPALGKRPGEILKLCNGNTLEVEVPGDRWGLDAIRRTWTRKGAGGSLNMTEAVSKFDGTVKFSPVELDFEAFLHAKPTARREILEAVLPPIDGEKVAAEIQNELQGAGIFDVHSSDFIDLISTLGTSGREWKQEAERLKGAIQSLEIDLAEEPTVVDFAGDADELKKRRDEILAAQGKHAADVAALSDRLKRTVEEPSEKKPTKKAIEAAKRSVKAAEKAVETNRHLKNEIVKVRDQEEPAEIVKIRAELNALREEADAVNESRSITKARVKDLQERRDRLSSCQACPTCGIEGIEFHTSVAELIDTPLEDLKGGLARLDEQLEAFEADRAALEASLHAAVDEWNDGKGHAIAALEAEIDLDAEIPSDDPARLELLVARWEQYKAFEPVSPAERSELEDRGIANAHNLAEVDGQLAELQRAERFKADLARKSGDLVRLKDELEATSKKVKGLKKLVDWAKRRSLEVTAERLNPLLDPANSVLAGVVEGSLAIDGTEIGLQQGETFRPIEVLSGAESTAVAAAIQVALASVGEVGIVIVDELSRLTWPRRRSLIGNLHAAVKAGLIKNALVLDHDADNWEDEVLEGAKDVAVYKIA